MMWVILSLIVLFILFLITVQHSAVQTYLAQRSASYLSKKLKTEVYIEKLKVAYPLDIDIRNLGISDLHGKPVFRTQKLQFSLAGLRPKAHNIKIRRIVLDEPEINLITYAGDSVMNFQFITDYFSSADTSESVSAPWTFSLVNASIINGSFSLHDYNIESEPFGMDYDHLNIDSINLNISNLTYINDTLMTFLQHLSAVESCGFKLNRMSANVLISPEQISTTNLIIQTPDSDLLLDLAFFFNDFNNFSDFVDSIYMQAKIFPSEFDLKDLVYFVPDIYGMNNKITIKGEVNGEVANLSLKDFDIGYGAYTRFAGNINLDGLPDIRETFIHMNARNLSTHYLDLEKFRLPSENGMPTFLKLPEQIVQLGLVKVKGRFTGFYNDFVLDGNFLTNYGSLTTDISLSYDLNSQYFLYKGELETNRFNLGKLLNQEDWIGRLNMNARIDGEGQLPSKFGTVFEANIDSLEFKGNILDKLQVKGELADKKFNGSLAINDELINFDFRGLVDLNDEIPVFNFIATLDNTNLARLNLIDRDETSLLSSKFEINFAGDNPDNLLGEILITDTRYSEAGENYRMDRFSLNAHPVDNGNRTLTLRSDFIDADFNGEFAYSQIYPAFLKILRYYLPSAGEEKSEIIEEKSEIIAETPDQSFVAVVTLKNTQAFSELFLPDIVINTNAIIETRFNSKEEMVGIVARASDISLYGTRIKDWYFNVSAKNQELNMKTGAGSFIIKEASESDTLALKLDRFLVEASFAGDTILYNIIWDNLKTSEAYNGDIKGYFTFINSPKLEFGFTESNIRINNIPWWFNLDHQVVIDTTTIEFNDLRFESSDQKLVINGKISDDPIEKLNISFDNWNLSNLDVILKAYDIDISGAINGKADLLDLYRNGTFLALLGIKNLTINKENLGDLEFNSSWDPYTKSVWLDSQIKYTGNVGTIIPFSMQGFYYPESETDNLDLKIDLHNFRLEMVNPFLRGIMANIKGLASGEVIVKGPASKPDVRGDISLMRTEFTVDFTNTRYSLADIVHIEKNKIWANNIKIYDEYGNSGIANLMFSHQNFNNWNMDIRVQANNLAGLHTTSSDNSLFYGTAYATGLFSLKGSFNDLVMDINVRSEPLTYINIPINFAVDVSDTDFIVFMNPESDTLKENITEIERSSFKMNMDMSITRDAIVQIFLPYQMGNIRSSGSGNMKMNYNKSGDFSMYGDYITEQGTFLFTIQNMINRLFTLVPGGTIRWSGDAYNAEINLQATYKTRVTLNSLPNISDEYRNRRFPVDCIISLKNSLMNPEISFGIRMPNVDEDIQRQVFSTVDTTNEVIMSRQMISLLVLNNFNFTTDQAHLTSTLGSSSFELITNQLTNWLSQISKDFDIGINYRPADQLSSEELEVALSTQLWDDRVIIDGNIGMSGDRVAQQNASNIIGDINVEVKLTPDGRIRVKAFNKYNNQEITGREAPYTQGIGVFYRREFDKLNELWIPKKSRIEVKLPDNGNDIIINDIKH